MQMPLNAGRSCAGAFFAQNEKLPANIREKAMFLFNDLLARTIEFFRFFFIAVTFISNEIFRDDKDSYF
jgi:hypothetical protein